MGKIRAADLQKLQKSLAFFVRVFQAERPTVVVADIHVSKGPGKGKSNKKKVSLRAVSIPVVRLNGLHGHSRFLKELLAMDHGGDYSYWEPHLKRRLIRLKHLVAGYKDYDSAMVRLMKSVVDTTASKMLVGVSIPLLGVVPKGIDSEAALKEMLEEAGEALFGVAGNLIMDADVILRRLAAVDGRSASMLEYPHNKGAESATVAVPTTIEVPTADATGAKRVSVSNH